MMKITPISLKEMFSAYRVGLMPKRRGDLVKGKLFSRNQMLPLLSGILLPCCPSVDQSFPSYFPGLLFTVLNFFLV